MSQQRMPMVLTSHGIPHLMGYLATKSGEHTAKPLGPIGMMDTAVELGHCGVELLIPFHDQDGLARLKDEADRRSLSIMPSGGILPDTSADDLREWIDAAVRIGAPVVRFILSGVLCGDRRSLAEGWEGRMAASAARLREVLPYAGDKGVALAIENHQDATSDDLLRLGEMTGNSPSYGVTLDCGNPLAVGEDPVEFARKVAHLIRHVHGKDYTIHYAPNGYRLVRCAAGDGVVDFPTIFEIVGGNGHGVVPGNEVAAQATRTIPMLEPGWWECHKPREASALIPVLKILWESGRPMDEPYSSAWERGEDSAAVAEQEWDQVRRSAAYFRILTTGSGS